MLRAIAGQIWINLFPRPKPPNYRDAVGGLWDVVGPLQFRFMLAQGLQSEHVLLDIGCGSLRAGRLFIAHLAKGNYLGLDADRALVMEGLKNELPWEVVDAKAPCFAFSEVFEFAFDKRPHFAIAQSLFTHLTSQQISSCLLKLGEFAPAVKLFATFYEAPIRVPKLPQHSRRNYWYTRDELNDVAAGAGWTMSYIGNWGHPRAQKMARFERSRSP